MDFLARREHSFFELTQKLIKKFPESDDHLIFEVLDTLRKENLQSDDRFTESYVRYRTGKGFGIMHVQADLKSRKVSEALISDYLDAIDDWDLKIQALILKKLGEQNRTAYGSKQHRKLVRFLQARGFTSAQIRKGMEKWLVF